MDLFLLDTIDYHNIKYQNMLHKTIIMRAIAGNYKPRKLSPVFCVHGILHQISYLSRARIPPKEETIS